MRQGDPTTKSGPETPGPSDFADPLTGRELKRAVVWAGVVVAMLLLYALAQPLLLIFGGIVFAAMLDGGTRLLGRVLSIRRSLRLAIVAVLVTIFIVGFFLMAGAQFAGQAQALQQTIAGQITRILAWAHAKGFLAADTGVKEIGGQLMGSFGKVTAVLGSALGALSSLAMIIVLGLFIAMEPRLYERGIAWMLPMANRRDFYRTANRMGHTLRLTIDAGAQEFAARRMGPNSGSAVLIDVSTGGILALASMPAYDPNRFSDGISA